MAEECLSYRFGAGRYIQESDVLGKSGKEVKRYGNKAYVIGGNTALGVVHDRMLKSFDEAGLEYVTEEFQGYPSREKIEELKQAVEAAGCDVIVAVGGGHIMDLAKAAAGESGRPVVAIPTSAATCAAYSPLSVLYTPEGHSIGSIQFDYEVASVLVDEQAMLTQTPRLLAAGILDAMAKYVEIETLKPHHLDENTSIDIHSAFYMAKYTYDMLWKIGSKAIEDLKKHEWSKELHEVIYINIALTGMISAMMRGRGQTTLGHAFDGELRKSYLDKVKPCLHGETVAMGLLANLVYNEREESAVIELENYMKNFGMKCTLEEVGIHVDDEVMKTLLVGLETHPFMVHDDEHRKLAEKAIRRVAK